MEKPLYTAMPGKLLFVDSQLIEPGDEFTSEAVPGENWKPLNGAAEAAVGAMNFKPPERLPGDRRTPLVEIPENWRTLDKVDTVRIARRLGAPNGTKAPEAVAWIEKELAARALRAAA